MTDKKISELANILGSQVDDANDELAIVDSSAGTTNSITRAELLSSVSAMSITGDLTVDTDTLYVDSSNNRVGIGTSSPDKALHVVGRATVRSGTALTDPDNPDTHLSVHDGSDSCFVSVRSDDALSAGLLFGDSTDDFAGGFQYDNANDSLSMHSGNSEAMRIDSSGNLLVGTTTLNISTSSSATGLVVNNDGLVEIGRIATTLICNRVSGTGGNVIFRQAGNTVGAISVTTSTTSYNTSSDERLKENIADAQSASNLIDGIQVREFDWKADGEHQRYGMIAQELETVAPEAVTKGETEDDIWAVDYSKLVPMLVKEIQDLRKRVADLET